MIVPDVNLLVHAHDAGSRRHAAARRWWEGLMNGTVTVGLPWAAILGFVGVATDGRSSTVRSTRTAPSPASARGSDRPQTAIVHPGERHAEILFDLLDEAGTAADLTAPAHLAGPGDRAPGRAAFDGCGDGKVLRGSGGGIPLG